jgi:WD40 repeat protein
MKFTRLLLLVSLLSLALPLQAAPDEDALPAGGRLRLGSNRLRHGGVVQGVVYAADGKLLASIASDRVLRVWNAQTGRLVAQTDAVPSIPSTIRFSPDGKFVAANDFQSDARVWDASSGKSRWLSRQYNGSTLAWSPDGKIIATGGRDGHIRLLDAADGKVIRPLTAQFGVVLALGFSDDGDTFISVTSDAILRRWETKTGNLSTHFPLAKNVYWGNRQANTFAFSPDGKWLAATIGSNVEIWSTIKSEAPQLLAGSVSSSGLCSPSFSADGRFLATGFTTGVISLWGVTTGRELRSFAGSRRAVTALALSPDSRTLCSGLGASLSINSTADGKSLLSDEMPLGGVRSLAFLRGGKQLVTFHDDGVVNAWDSASGKRIEQLAEHFDIGHELAVISGGKAVRLMIPPKTWLDWEPGGRKETRSAGVTMARPLSPDGKTVIRVETSKAFMHDIETGKDLRPVADPPLSYQQLIWSPEGQRFLSRVAANQQLHAWDVSHGRQVIAFPAPPVGPQGFQPTLLSPGGRMLVQGSNEVRIWEVASGRERMRLALPNGQLSSGVFSRDGRTLVLGLMNGEVSVVNLDTAKEILRRQAHRGQVRSVRFSPDETLLATGSDDTTTLIWDAAPFHAPPAVAIKPTAEEVSRWWDELAAEDASKAFATVRAMSSTPAETVALIKSKLEPIKDDVTKRIDKLIADLDARRFQQREKAMRELAEIGPDAEKAIEAALPTAPSIDAKRRMEELLKQLKGRPQEGRLRGLRAVEVLERAGTAEAIEVLKTLAGGAPEAWLTREARAALDRR